MSKTTSNIRFKAKLLRPAEPPKGSSWTFLILPKDVSAKLSTRGMTTVEGIINGHPFRATLEPDGQKSHWFKVNKKMREAAGVEVGDVVPIEIQSVGKEPEPQVPVDLRKALAAVGLDSIVRVSAPPRPRIRRRLRPLCANRVPMWEVIHE